MPPKKATKRRPLPPSKAPRMSASSSMPLQQLASSSSPTPSPSPVRAPASAPISPPTRRRRAAGTAPTRRSGRVQVPRRLFDGIVLEPVTHAPERRRIRRTRRTLSVTPPAVAGNDDGGDDGNDNDDDDDGGDGNNSRAPRKRKASGRDPSYRGRAPEDDDDEDDEGERKPLSSKRARTADDKRSGKAQQSTDPEKQAPTSQSNPRSSSSASQKSKQAKQHATRRKLQDADRTYRPTTDEKFAAADRHSPLPSPTRKPKLTANRRRKPRAKSARASSTPLPKLLTAATLAHKAVSWADGEPSADTSSSRKVKQHYPPSPRSPWMIHEGSGLFASAVVRRPSPRPKRIVTNQGAPEDFGEPVAVRRSPVLILGDVIIDLEEEQRLCGAWSESSRSRSVSPEQGLSRKVRGVRRAVSAGSLWGRN